MVWIVVYMKKKEMSCSNQISFFPAKRLHMFLNIEFMLEVCVKTEKVNTKNIQ